MSCMYGIRLAAEARAAALPPISPSLRCRRRDQASPSRLSFPRSTSLQHRARGCVCVCGGEPGLLSCRTQHAACMAIEPERLQRLAHAEKHAWSLRFPPSWSSPLWIPRRCYSHTPSHTLTASRSHSPPTCALPRPVPSRAISFDCTGCTTSFLRLFVSLEVQCWLSSARRLAGCSYYCVIFDQDLGYRIAEITFPRPQQPNQRVDQNCIWFKPRRY